MKKQIVILAICSLSLQVAFAQFTLDGQIRPRAEYRNGFGTIIPDSADAGFAISTRARLNAGYNSETYQLYLSLQDVMVWGENRQILPADLNNSFAIFQAWAKLILGGGFSTKLGRQVISYDDQRIFGGLDWAQQGRNHDAALISYGEEGLTIDLGLAFNQDFGDPSGFQSQGTTYNTNGFFSYKTMQYLYLNKKWDSFAASVLALNNGFQNFDAAGAGDGISNLQTFGTHLNYKKGAFGAAANAFIQTGERQGALDVKGTYLLGLDLNYKISDKVVLGLGTELISGDQSDTPDETESFFPLYGTNHKFNGLMDYFYVGNHANSIGMFDLHVSANIDLGRQSALMVKVLNFNGDQELPSGEKSLGTEIDLVYSKTFKGYSLQLGYSHLFPADGMYELKGVTEAEAAGTQNWAWAMLILKPKFLDGSSED